MMNKDATYKEKLALLDEWMPAIIESVKKDLKNEHLKQDFLFVKKYFQGKNLQKIELAEFVQAYRQAIQNEEQGETIAEFIANRWIIKNSDLYHFFEIQLSAISPDFSALEEIESANSAMMIEAAQNEYGALNTYIFAILNSVAFRDEDFQQLNNLAHAEVKKQHETCAVEQERQDLEALKRNHERELARMTDKYEKKLSGLQRKYQNDLEAWKKQVAALQKKLQTPCI